MKLFDIAIIGAGPAGASSAYHSNKFGLSTILFEKETLPRHKACGGAVALHVQEILDFSISPVVERKISKMFISIGLKKYFISDFKRPFVYMVMRDKFDYYLIEQAKNTGTTIKDNCSLLGIKKGNNGNYIIKTTNLEVEAKYIIGADGANSTVRKLVSAPPSQNTFIAIDREVYSDKLYLNKWKETLFLDFACLPSGYAWAFPKKNNYSTGAGTSKKFSKMLKTYYKQFTNRYQNELNFQKTFIEQGHPLPVRKKGEKIVFDNIIFVGDAAGLIDPMSGEGIYYAIRSGQIAAETINSVSEGSCDISEYEKVIEKEIQPELHISEGMLKVLNFAPKFWVSILLREKNPFFKYYCKIFTGEKTYMDFVKKFGMPAKLFFDLINK
jgi:geranylgeranyl reductase family protein